MKTNSYRLFPVIAVASCALFGAPVVNAQDAVQAALRERIEWLKSTDAPTIDDSPIAAIRAIVLLYERRGYEPAWTEPAMVRELYENVLHAFEHGLDPRDFHAGPIGRRLADGALEDDPSAIAASEILFTDAMARLGVSLHFGKLDPAKLEPAWNFSRRFFSDDPVGFLDSVLRSRRIDAAVTELIPGTPLYERHKRALATYRAILAAGGWPDVSDGEVLQVGSAGPRVAVLRERLRVTGDLAGPAAADTEDFDQALALAVERFQRRNGLEVDGKVGARTLAELNLPVTARIDQLRATLERIRWVFRDIPSSFVIVDIAGFNLHLFRNGLDVWQTRVQVGKPYHETPVFRDDIRFMEINPTWTIPPGILRRSTLPAIRKDPAYLAENNMTVLTTSGQKVDPATIDWAATASGGFPYMIRQEPGPKNALGLVKFMFPNKYMVYLHDTPSKGLFARTERAFSSGCIRVQDPFRFAELLLADQPGWDRARLDQVVASAKTTRVDLASPMPVLILYWTAEAHEDGTVQFRKDIYSRDAKIIKGLDAPFQFAPLQGTLANPGSLSRPR